MSSTDPQEAGRRPAQVLSRWFRRDTGTVVDLPMVNAPRQSHGATGVPVPAASAISAQPAVASMGPTPAARGSNTITSLRDLPEYNEVLTERGGPIEISDADRRAVAIILPVDDRISQRNSAITLWTGYAEDFEPLRYVERRARQAGYHTLSDRYICSPELLSSIYHSAKSARDDGESAVAAEKPGDKNGMEKFIQEMTTAAVAANASDIHILVREDLRTTIEFRVNGDLRPYRNISSQQGDALRNALFVSADAAAKTGTTFDQQAFQDARIDQMISTHLKGEQRDVKVSMRYASSPVFPGKSSKIVMRVLPQVQGEEAFWSLEDLGYSAAQSAAIERMLASPQGLILMVGTTGSGKSRTLQTLMGLLNRKFAGRKNLVSIEDPPEYHMAGVTQIPVRRATDLSAEAAHAERGFAAALRAQMRADPDIIMVGEIRDAATAKLVQAAMQTGHKVLSTLHATNPFEAIERLVDLGFQRSVLATEGAINGIIYQKLIQRVCPKCSREFEPSGSARDLIGKPMLTRIASHGRSGLFKIRLRGEGCSECGQNSNGVIGRTVVAEMLANPGLEMLELIKRSETNIARMLWRSAAAGGVHAAKWSTDLTMGKTCLDHAVEKMFAGQISPYDVEDEIGPLDGQMDPAKAQAFVQSALQANRSLGELFNGATP